MNILVLITNGSEDSELVGTTSLLKRAGIETTLLAFNSESYVTCSHGIKIIPNMNINNANTANLYRYDGLFLPGGGAGSKELRENEKALDIVRHYAKEKKPIFAICGAPSILGAAGVMRGRRFTCYDSFEVYVKEGAYVKENVVKDINIITAKSVNYVTEFGLTIIEYLISKAKKEEVSKQILRS